MLDIIDLAQAPIPTLLRFNELLVEGDASPLLALFSGEPLIDTPRHGEMRGKEAFIEFVTEQRSWLQERDARPHFFDITIGEDRIVVEYSVDLKQNDNTFDLPLALVVDRNGEGISAMRIYHSIWPVAGKHAIRPPVLAPPEEKLDEPAIIQAYMAGIHEPNTELVLSLFAEDGYVREPSGSRYKHTGSVGLKAFYGQALGAGGVVLHHCTATFDGRSFAVEYICDEWANQKLPPQAGLAIYELAGPDKIQGVRIYDDVMPPFE